VDVLAAALRVLGKAGIGEQVIVMKNETDSIGGQVRSFITPRPGEDVVYICKECGERFLSKIPLLFNKGVKKCPKCGKFKAVMDDRIRY